MCTVGRGQRISAVCDPEWARVCCCGRWRVTPRRCHRGSVDGERGREARNSSRTFWARRPRPPGWWLNHRCPRCCVAGASYARHGRELRARVTCVVLMDSDRTDGQREIALAWQPPATKVSAIGFCKLPQCGAQWMGGGGAYNRIIGVAEANDQQDRLLTQPGHLDGK